MNRTDKNVLFKGREGQTPVIRLYYNIRIQQKWCSWPSSLKGEDSALIREDSHDFDL